MAPTKRKQAAPKLRLRKSAARAPKAPASIHELEISLCEIEPRIWRRFVVRSDASLARLHDVIQVVMGWYDCHLHQFIGPDETRYSPPYREMDFDWDADVIDERKVKIRKALPDVGSRLVYEYDFGDGWEHVIEVVDIHPPEPGTRYPRCLAGERACPPEDCGGPYSYPELLAALANPKHPEHEQLTEWVGGAFDAEALDVDRVNRGLVGFR
jgi:hypothetical protein